MPIPVRCKPSSTTLDFSSATAGAGDDVLKAATLQSSLLCLTPLSDKRTRKRHTFLRQLRIIPTESWPGGRRRISSGHPGTDPSEMTKAAL
jgi:hypothetical protein